MTDYAETFIRTAEKCKLLGDACKYAAANLEPMRHHSEQEVVGLLGRFDIVFAIWYSAGHDTLCLRRIKGPDNIVCDGKSTVNAIPVANEGEAERWANLLGGSLAPRRELAPRLIARDGALVE